MPAARLLQIARPGRRIPGSIFWQQAGPRLAVIAEEHRQARRFCVAWASCCQMSFGDRSCSGTSALDVGDLEVVIEVRSELFEQRVQARQRRAD
jgi:hypothetical protein